MNIRTTIARLIILAQLAYTFYIYHSLPATIPNAYDNAGTPHRFAPRAILWFFLLLSVGVHILLSAITRHPNSFNLPSDRNDPDRPRQTKIAVEMLSMTQLFVAFLLATPAWSLAHEQSQHWLLIMLPFDAAIVAILATVITGIYRIMTPPRDT